MKLSNTQINAIIEQVAKTEQPKLDSKYKKDLAELLKEKTPLAKKYFSIWNSLPDELKKYLSPYDKVTEKRILDSICYLEKEYFNTKELRNKIIISSIDSKDIDELKKSLGISF